MRFSPAQPACGFAIATDAVVDGSERWLEPELQPAIEIVERSAHATSVRKRFIFII